MASDKKVLEPLQSMIAIAQLCLSFIFKLKMYVQYTYCVNIEMNVHIIIQKINEKNNHSNLYCIRNTA